VTRILVRNETRELKGNDKVEIIHLEREGTIKEVSKASTPKLYRVSYNGPPNKLGWFQDSQLRRITSFRSNSNEEGRTGFREEDPEDNHGDEEVKSFRDTIRVV